MQSIPRGLNESAEIINFLFIIGGTFGVLKGTGALDALLKFALVKLKGRERMVIPVVLMFWGLRWSNNWKLRRMFGIFASANNALFSF